MRLELTEDSRGRCADLDLPTAVLTEVLDHGGCRAVR